MIKLEIDGQKYVAQTGFEQTYVVLGYATVEVGGKKHYMIEMDALPCGDFGRATLKSGDKIMVTRLANDQ